MIGLMGESDNRVRNRSNRQMQYIRIFSCLGIGRKYTVECGWRAAAGSARLVWISRAGPEPRRASVCKSYRPPSNKSGPDGNIKLSLIDTAPLVHTFLHMIYVWRVARDDMVLAATGCSLQVVRSISQCSGRMLGSQYDRGDLLTSDKMRLCSSIPALGLSHMHIYDRVSPAAHLHDSTFCVGFEGAHFPSTQRPPCWNWTLQ
jgi:hypothetical protein